MFGFVAGGGFCLLPAAIAPPPAVSALPLPSGFLTSTPVLFDFGAGNGSGLPTALPPGLAVSTLRLPSGVLGSAVAIFVFATGAASFGFGADNGIDLPSVAARTPVVPSRFATSIVAVFGLGTGNGILLPAAIMSSSRGSNITKRAEWRIRLAMRLASSPAPK